MKDKPTDIPDLSAAVHSLQSAIETAKTLVEMKISDEIRDRVTKLRTEILAAQESALTAKLQCVELVEQNTQLRREIVRLNDQIQTREAMIYRDNVYWRQLENRSWEGPFCPKCLDGTNKPTRMTDLPEEDFWRCHVCDHLVDKPGRRPSIDRADSDWDPYTQ